MTFLKDIQVQTSAKNEKAHDRFSLAYIISSMFFEHDTIISELNDASRPLWKIAEEMEKLHLGTCICEEKYILR